MAGPFRAGVRRRVLRYGSQGLTPRTGVLTSRHLMDTPETSVLARLREEFPDSSGRRLRAWLVAGRVRVKGEIVRDPRTPVAPGDPVTLGPAPPPALAAPLRLVHEDDVAPRHREAVRAPHDRDRARAGAHGLPHGVGLPQGRAALPPAVHRPPAGPGDLGAPGHRQDSGDEAVSPGAVLLGHRGAAVRRDRRGRGDGGRGHAPRRPGGGALAPRPARRSDPAAAEGPARAHRDHPVPRGRAASGRDPGVAPARHGPAPPDPRPDGEARPPGRRRHPPRRAPGPAPAPVPSRDPARLPPSRHRGAGRVRLRAAGRVRQPRATGGPPGVAAGSPPGARHP